MISNRILEDILQDPLGPYHDRDVLDEKLCQMKGITELVLYSFTLEHNGRLTGLDESEHPLEGPDNRKFRFRGILKIANPDWLSDFGVRTIEAELNLRVKERVLRLGEGVRRPPRLTLDNLFGRHLMKSQSARQKEGDTTLTILIQGERNMPANFMFSDRMPDGLLWNSKDHNRNYKIATMDVDTYSRSENFFWRWRLFALMEKIRKACPWVPPKKRTPIWFVEVYLARFACPPEDKHRRLIFDAEGDEDVDETGRTVTPRHLLKPHASEILGMFAAQAEWFITNNVVKRKELIDLVSWQKFAEKVRKERKRACREADVKWGCPVGWHAESSEDERDEDEDESRLNRLVRENPVIGKSNQAVVRKLQLAQGRPNRETRLDTPSASESEGEAPGGVEYVSDFSEPSDAEEVDSDHRAAEEMAMCQIPWELQQPPSLPDVDGRWWCPLRGCNYEIDLYDLTEEERRMLPKESIAYILEKQWRNAAYDEKVVQGFRSLVTNHYMKHIQECEVKAEGREGRLRFVFVDGRRRHQGDGQPIRGPMPARGTLGGESRVVPIVHGPQVQ